MTSYRLGRTLLSTEVIQARVRELAAAISRDYAGQDLLLICVLKGAAIFWADLARALTIPCQSDFVAMESYGDATRPAERPRFTKAAGISLQGRNILLVEDIIDTGHTISHLRALLQAQAPQSVALCALLDKVDRREVPVTIEYRGFVIPDVFVVGYGLDHGQQYRHLPFIACMEPAGAAEAHGQPGRT